MINWQRRSALWGEGMSYRGLVGGVLVLALVVALPRSATAAPISIPASLAADYVHSVEAPGPGLCASAVHLNTDDVLVNVSVARAALGQAVGTGYVDDSVRFVAPVIHFRNSDPAASTDYPSPAALPFARLAGAPKVGDDRNIAMRARGYINIYRAGIFTFSVLADDGYSLLVAGVPILSSTVTGYSLRDSRQVDFAAPGFYAIELTYFQNGGPAAVQLAVANRADAEVQQFGQSLGPSFVLANSTSQSALFPAIAGATDCTECQSDASCGAGRGLYCGNGICQKCILNSHCGPSCQVCSSSGQVCVAGACAPCTFDEQCGPGNACDVPNGQCIPRPTLTYSGGCQLAATRAPQSDDTSRGWLWLVPGLALILALRRYSFRRSRRRFGVAGLAVVALGFALAMPSSAQAQPLSFNAQTLRPAIGPGSSFTVEGTLIPKRLWPFASVVLDYANQPLRAVLPSGEAYAYPVTGMFTAHLLPGVALARFAAVAIDLPIVLFQGFDPRTPTSDVPFAPPPAGLGDLRLIGKLRILDNEAGGLGLAVVPQISFPTGSDTAFRGDGTVSIEPRVALDYRLRSGTLAGSFVGLNLAYSLRTYNREVDFGLVRVTDQIRYGVAAGINVARSLQLLGELTGAIGTSYLQGGPLYAPAEVLLGARYEHRSGLSFSLGAGGALHSAVGIPNLRLVASLSYALPGRPRLQPEPQPRPDGPAIDSDGDGVPDGADTCPQDRGTKENNGCPADRGPATPPGPAAGERDSDGDGIIDRLDKCPDKSGPVNLAGCPPRTATGPDRDRDGIEDAADKCPDLTGPVENNGCPDPDSDGDGVVNRLDKCPRKPGPRENEGCPLPSDANSKTVRFLPGTGNLDPVSLPILAALGRTLLADRTITGVMMTVSSEGDAAKAKRIVPKRMKALRVTLQAMGVSKRKLKIKAGPVPGTDEIREITLVRGKRRERFEPSSELSPNTQPSAGQSGSNSDRSATIDAPKAEGGRHHRRHHRSKKKKD